MKYTLEYEGEILDEEVLEMVNDEQDWHHLEKFDTLEEVPTELIWIALDAVDYMNDEINDYISATDFKINLIR